MRILVVRGGSLGDFILTLPAIVSLRRRWPDAHMEIMGHLSTLRLVENIVGGISSLDQAGLAPFFVKDGQLPKHLVNYFSSFDLIVSYTPDGDGLFRRNLLRAGAGRVISPAKVIPTRGEHIADQFLDVLHPLGIRNEGGPLTLTLGERDSCWAGQFWKEKELSWNVVCLHPGSGGEGKRWEGERFAQLGDWLRSELGARILIVSGEADEKVADEVAHKMKTRPILLRELELPRLASLLRRCRLFVGNDSGVSHLSALLGIPTIAIFGPSDPTIWGPRGKRVVIIRKDIRCSPCADFTSCQRECLRLISVDEVKDRAKCLLEA